MFPVQAQSAAQSGNLSAASQMQNGSVVCSIIAIVSTVIGFVVLIVIFIAIVDAIKR